MGATKVKKRARNKQVSPPDPPPNKSAKIWLLVLGLCAVTLLVYAPVRHFDFVSLDDGLYVTQNGNIAGGLSWQSIRWAFTTDRAGYWVPLTWLSHILDVEWYGLEAGSHHVTNVLLHVFTTLVLFGTLHRMTRSPYPSAFAAALFAIHPLHVESVAWIAERKDVLSALFFMTSLWAYALYTRKPNAARYMLVASAFAAGLMAKPMLVTLPFVLLLLDVWPLNRVRLEAGQAKVWRRLVLEKAPLLVLSIASSATTLIFHSERGGIGSFDVFPLGQRLANSISSYAAYMRDMFWPAHLAAFYPYEAVSMLRLTISAVVLIAISVFVIRKARSHTYLLVGWLWYLGTLMPVSGLVQAGTQARADRFTYIPLIGLFIMVAWGLPRLAERWQYRSFAPPIAGIVILLTAMAASRQVQYWENRSTLWERALQVTRGNYVAHNILGMALADAGRVDEAIAHYKQAIHARLDYSDAHNNLGIAFARQNRLDEAVSEFRKAIDLGKRAADPHYNLGFALALQGRTREALAQYDEALRVDPTLAAAHTKAGDALLNEGRIQDALVRYRNALRVQPGFALAHNNLGVALAALERYDEAIHHYDSAIRLQPTLVEAHNGLGAALANQGRYREAVGHFSNALRIQPGNAIALENLERVRP
jgi:tetratricopeptide (TPR) repeat protein